MVRAATWLAVLVGMVSVAPADVLHMPAGLTSLELVTVGNPGNAGELADITLPARVCGAVDYIYQIGKYEVTAGQYCEFLNAVAKTDTYGLYHADMWNDDRGCKIQRSGGSGSYTYSVASDWVNRPVNYVSWGDAARFANWMQNGQLAGAQDASTTEDGAYLLAGALTNPELLAVAREDDAIWAIPNEDEWYKAAYHRGNGTTGNYFDYPTGSDLPPGRDMEDASGNNANSRGPQMPIDPPYYMTITGEFQNSPSAYGTFDQGGNVWEWNEAVLDDSTRGVRGGSYYHSSGSASLHASARDINSYIDYPAHEYYTVGFRVAYIPEPAGLAMIVVGGVVLVRRRSCGS